MMDIAVEQGGGISGSMQGVSWDFTGWSFVDAADEAALSSAFAAASGYVAIHTNVDMSIPLNGFKGSTSIVGVQPGNSGAKTLQQNVAEMKDAFEKLLAGDKSAMNFSRTEQPKKKLLSNPTITLVCGDTEETKVDWIAFQYMNIKVDGTCKVGGYRLYGADFVDTANEKALKTGYAMAGSNKYVSGVAFDADRLAMEYANPSTTNYMALTFKEDGYEFEYVGSNAQAQPGYGAKYFVPLPPGGGDVSLVSTYQSADGFLLDVKLFHEGDCKDRKSVV